MKKILLAALGVFISICAVFAQKEANVYRFDRFKPDVFYSAPQSIEEVNGCELAVIMVHGWNGAIKLKKDSRIVQGKLPEAYVIATMFPTMADFKKNKKEYDGRAIWNNSWETSLKEPGVAGDDWRGGGDANGTGISSFDVIDEILARLSDRKKFPRLKRVVLAGFSGGGQFVSRYVAAGKGKVRKGIALEYVSMSPSTDFRFEKDVPWLWGLKDRPRYSAGLSEKKIMSNLCSRRCWKACGDKDVLEKALDKTQWGMAQGVNRYDRFLNLEKYLDEYPAWKAKVSFHTFKGIAHESEKAFADSTLINFISSGD